jgi:hypothetical protein
MIGWLKQLDTLLRGQSTEPELLRRGARELALRRFLILSLLLGGLYGFFMGWYSISNRTGGLMQLFASTVKLPLLFLLTLVVTFPSLYVFSALTGCRLTFSAVLRLLVATIVINLTVAASLGPILGFFTLSTTSYPFMIILNVALLGVAGFVALGFLLHTLRKISHSERPVRTFIAPESPAALEESPPGGSPSSPPGATPYLFTRRPEEQGYSVFYIWVIIYGLVGAQMGWLLRPFIGHPDLPFQWFRARQGNFFESVWTQLQHLF